MFDFKAVFEKAGMVFMAGLRNRMLRQESIDGGSYPRPKPSTLKARQRGLGKTNLRGRARKAPLTSVPITRMVVTRDTALSAFEFTATPSSLKVSVADKAHRYNGETYVDLIKYNSRGTGETNPNIVSPPLIFPNNAQEVELLKSEMMTAWELFHREATRQMNDRAQLKIREVLELKV